MAPFKKELIDLVKDKKISLIPEKWEKTYFHWIKNIKDWCISRQIEWGHRIPIWYNKKDPSEIICSDKEDLPHEVKVNKDKWEQDPDVLDTWFSSALLPFSLLGWPNETSDLKNFYPNSILITGHDILFFWVTKMLIMGLYNLKRIPFKDIFLHGLIYSKSYFRKDKEGMLDYLSLEEKLSYDMGKTLPKDIKCTWEKMSKSKNNVINPLEIIDLYGTDALRIALCSSVCSAHQIDLDRRKFEEYKNFANKIWNASKFIFSNISDLTEEEINEEMEEYLLEDEWIFMRLNKVILETTKSLKSYEFDKALKLAYEFFWDDFCAYYLEIAKHFIYKENKSKTILKQKILLIVLNNSIRLLHPFAPFITEKIFLYMKSLYDVDKFKYKENVYINDLIRSLKKDACIINDYPSAQKNIKENNFIFFKRLIHKIRNIRAEIKLNQKTKTDIYIIANEKLSLIRQNIHIILSLTKTNQIYFINDIKDISFHYASEAIENVKIFIPLDITLLKKEIARIEKEIEKHNQTKEVILKKLNNKAFIKNAPKNILEQTKNNFNKITIQIKQLKEKVQDLKNNKI